LWIIDALLSDRHIVRMDKRENIGIYTQGAGIHFDPKVVETFLSAEGLLV